ncbi:MAG: ComEC family competence protein [Alphaproteobacteria bacterium]|jgi:ComEC/Rec2-related protein|nr:ComEC family competence protein [Alphaproteobacteria bacterium]
MFIISAITYILGIVFYFILLADYKIYLLIASIFVMLFFLKYPPTFKHLKSYFLLIFFLGLWVAAFSGLKNTTTLIDKEFQFETIYGEVASIEKSNYDNKQYVYLKDVIFTSIPYANQNPEHIQLRLTYNRTSQLKVGDLVKATAMIYPPSESVIQFGYNFKENNRFKHISGNGYVVGRISLIRESESTDNKSLLSPIDNFRESFKDKIKNDMKQYLDKEMAAFIIAISIGEYTFLPKHDMDALRFSSLAHLISISGYHISVISAFLFFFLRYTLSLFPHLALNYDTKKIAAFITIWFLLFYIFIIGDNSPAIRATIMGVAFLVMIIAGMRVISFNSLFLAGILILSVNPFNLFSASFLLSYIATFALIYFCNLQWVRNLDRQSKRNIFFRWLFLFIFSICLTLFIEISIFPLIAYYFGTIPLNGAAANMLSSPIFSFLIMPSLIIYFFTPIFIGKYFLWLSAFGMELVLKIARFFSSTTYALFYVDFFSGAFLVIILLLYVAAVLMKNKYSFVFLGLYVAMVGLYFIKPSPDIIIDSTGVSLAVHDDGKYYFSEKADSFVKNIWFKNPNVDIKNKITNMEDAECADYHCVFGLKNIMVSLAESNKYFYEDCGAVDIIFITNKNSQSNCSASLVIDKNFLQKNGATEIYIHGNKITFFSVHDSYFATLRKFFLQYL